MRRSISVGLVAIALAFGAANTASADPFSDGYAAYERADYPVALRIWEPLAKKGDRAARFNLGLMYDNGQGVPQNHTEAVKWFRLAADQGLASAQFNLGNMHDKGQGVQQDYVASHVWFNLAGAAGLDIASTNRDRVASKMSSAQIAEAQRLAASWKPK